MAGAAGGSQGGKWEVESCVSLFPSNSPARPPAGGEGRPEARRVIAGRPSSGR